MTVDVLESFSVADHERVRAMSRTRELQPGDCLYDQGSVATAAFLVTGGTAVEPTTTAPDEIRGKEIQGGESRRISKGDVVVVPNGVPHWFKQVDGPLLYYVVKVTAAK